MVRVRQSSLRAFFWYIDIWIWRTANACSFWWKFWPSRIANMSRFLFLCVHAGSHNVIGGCACVTTASLTVLVPLLQWCVVVVAARPTERGGKQGILPRGPQTFKGPNEVIFPLWAASSHCFFIFRIVWTQWVHERLGIECFHGQCRQTLWRV